MAKGARGAKGKYIPVVVNRLLQIIEQTGQIKAACEAAGIAQDTFFRWMKEKPEFSESVADAREAFYSREDPELVNRTRAALIYHLRPHEEKWESIETTTLPDGSEVVKKSERATVKPPSEWAVRMVVPMLSGAPAGAEQILQQITGSEGGAVEIVIGGIGDGDEGGSENPAPDTARPPPGATGDPDL